MLNIYMDSIMKVLNEKEVLNIARKNIRIISQPEKGKIKSKITDGISQYQKLKNSYCKYSRKV